MKETVVDATCKLCQRELSGRFATGNPENQEIIMLKYLLTGILAAGFMLVGPEVKEADAGRYYRNYRNFSRHYQRPNYRYHYRYNYSPRRYNNYRHYGWGNSHRYNNYRYNNYRRGGVGIYYNF
ncbi:MAG: hypothetical protein ACE37I_03685 [Rubinisphaera brasiliensis]|uniref:hypothetical protein n=1 Tax=Rubinisphaera brasiliensis TaxID=119 RepID=UPI000C3CB2AB|nr:hypothetical protein [Planctomyces sp.]MBR9802855.1 hypothetical protein [bacterium]